MPNGYLELIAATRVEVTSDDARITASIVGDDTLRVAFPHGFDEPEESALCERIADLLTRVYAERQRARLNALAEAVGDVVTPRRPWQLDARERRFRQLLAETTAVGTSREENLKLRLLGGARWEMKIRPGQLKKLDERRFLAELATAVRATLTAQRSTVAEIRREVFGETRRKGQVDGGDVRSRARRESR